MAKPSRGVVVALEGPSGVGKSTVAASLAARYAWPVVAEAVDRLDPAPSLAFRTERELLRLERTLLDEDARRFGVACELGRHHPVVIADTGFLGPLSYTSGLVRLGRARRRTLEQLVQEARDLASTGRLGAPDLTVYLDAPEETLRLRLRGSIARHPVGLRSRHALVGRYEADVVRPWLARQWPGRVVRLRAEQEVRSVTPRLVRAVRSQLPLRDPDRAALRALDRWVTGLFGTAPSPRQPL